VVITADTAWDIMDMDEVELAQSPSALETGDAVQRVVNITTSPKTSTACVAALLARVLQLLSTLPTRHQWARPRNSVWDQARWLALQVLLPTVLVQLLSVQELHLLLNHQVTTACLLVWVVLELASPKWAA
jgi:hypothetical protein